MSWNSLRSSTRHCGSSDGGQRLAEAASPCSPSVSAVIERALGAAVQVLGAALGGQRAAVQLEVDLADPDRQLGLVRALRAASANQSATLAGAQRGHDGEVGELRAGALEHLLASGPPPPSP